MKIIFVILVIIAILAGLIAFVAACDPEGRGRRMSVWALVIAIAAILADIAVAWMR